MRFSNFDMKMFNEARIEAEKSTYDRFHVGAVITYKHAIIGRGRNSIKSHPLQKKYNRKYRIFNNDNGAYISDSLHAELSALVSVSYTTGIQVDWSKANIYVYRVSTGSKLGYACSKPCPACMNAIKDIGIKNVFYSDDEGFSYLKLD